MSDFRVDLSKVTEYDGLAAETDKQYGLPEGTAKLVMMIENRNDPKNRVSPKGASGVMQIMPANFKALGVTDPNDPVQSFQAAGKLLSDALKRYDGNVGAALADYNGGPRAAERYLKGEALHPETAEYLGFAQEYINSGGKTTSYGKTVVEAGINEVEAIAPSDFYQNEEQGHIAFVTGLDEEAERRLQDEAKFHDLSFTDAVKYGFGETLTSALAHAASREEDANYALTEDNFSTIRQQFPEGLSAGQEKRIRNSRSEADLEYNVTKTKQENDFGRRMQTQMGWNAAGAYAGVLAGGIFDPVALPLGTFGAAARVIKGSSIVASAGRMGVEGAAASAIVSPLVQQADKGSVDASEVIQHAALGAVAGAGLGMVLRTPATAKFDEVTQESLQSKLDGGFTTTPREPLTEGYAVDFNDYKTTTLGDSGEIIGLGPTAIRDAASRWDESYGVAQADKVRNRRIAWYTNPIRSKVLGWSDSEGVKLARSKSKEARFVGAMWAGDAAGLGRQQARTAAVLKAQMQEVMQFDHIPVLKAEFEAAMTPAEKLNYMAGGEKAAQERFSREVQLERYRHRIYRSENSGSSKGYVSDAPAPIQRAAANLDELMEKSKQMQLEAGTEHASILKDMDSVGYIEQRPNYIRINRATPEERKAFLDMVKDDYHAEATAKINRMKEGKAEWIENRKQQLMTEASAKAQGGKPKLSPYAQRFLKNPEKYFDAEIEKLAVKIHGEMDKRASHWWENALRDPEARYQNSEASLMTMAKEMSDEWFSGKQVDADLVKGFQTALTSKWADTSRRELNMLNSRNINGQTLYLLDMFNHDVFASATGTINNVSGRVAMAKLGWKTEQDIDDTLMALTHSGATTEEVASAKHISDLILGRAKVIGDDPLVQSVSNMTHATMMGKLGLSIVADFPMAVGNLGVGGIIDALGKSASKVMDGSMFVRNGRLTQVGSDLDALTKGLLGHDNELWVPQQLNANGMAMEAGGTLLRRTAAAARFTNTMSGANAMSKMIGTGVTRASNNLLHKQLRTGKGISEARLAEVGLTPKELTRIQKQFDKYAGKDNFGLDKWDDPLAKEDFIASAHRFAQQSTLNKQYAGETPAWVSQTVLGYIYSRFRAIGLRAQEKVLVSNLTLADSNTVAMLTAGIGFATFLAYARIYADAATSKDGAKLLKERLTPAGIADQVARFTSVMGLASEGTSLLNTLTGGAVAGGSDTPLTGLGKNIGGLVGSVATGDPSKVGQAATKLLPGANTYQMLLLRNQVLAE